jgi:dolichol-phosphate mannosyltransferase
MPHLSVVVPVFNERDNIPPLLAEIAAALRGKVDYEVIYVDDDSSDDSRAVLAAQKALYPELRVLHHVTRSGQSTAVWNGVRAARGAWIATLDGDGQNDPADIPKLLAARDAAAAEVKLFEREVFLRLPYFDHMHRYLPALVKRAGFQSQSVPVGHRPRTAGVSKYGMLDRLWVGLADLRGVAWLMRRGKVTRVEEL